MRRACLYVYVYRQFVRCVHQHTRVFGWFYVVVLNNNWIVDLSILLVVLCLSLDSLDSFDSFALSACASLCRCARAQLCISFNSDIFTAWIEEEEDEKITWDAFPYLMHFRCFYISLLSFVRFKFQMYCRWMPYLFVSDVRARHPSIHCSVKNQTLKLIFP